MFIPFDSYDQELQAASEHVVNYLESRERPVAGTTYKQLRALVGDINKCGYFERPKEEEPEEEAQPQPDSTDAG